MVHVVNKYTKPKDLKTIYIGRGSVLGNNWSSKAGTKATHQVESREKSVALYKEWLLAHQHSGDVRDELNRIWKLALLEDVYLECFCKPKLCHGDVIAELINSKLPRQ